MITILALIATAILVAITIFQLALIFGAPFGRFAWGGTYTKLPRKLRIASVTSIILYGLFAAFILSKAGVAEIITNQTIVQVGMWVFTVYFFLGIVLNAISRSKPERYLMTPVVTALAILFLFVTLS